MASYGYAGTIHAPTSVTVEVDKATSKVLAIAPAGPTSPVEQRADFGARGM